MPRAFLIKKKKCLFDDCERRTPFERCGDNDENVIFPKTKKRKSYEDMTNKINHNELKSDEEKIAYEDSGSEGTSCSIDVSRSPTPPPNCDSHPPGHFDVVFPYHRNPTVAAAAANEPAVLSDHSLSYSASHVFTTFNYPHHVAPHALYGQSYSYVYPHAQLPSSGHLPTGPRASGNDRYACSECDKKYSTCGGLRKHEQFHCASIYPQTFTCKHCDKAYRSLGALKMHVRTHTLPCKCDVCGKSFSRPWLLQGHLRTHTGEKPFACQHCRRAFADRSNLRAHLQTHSEVKKYVCSVCSKTFSRMSLLLKHQDGHC